MPRAGNAQFQLEYARKPKQCAANKKICSNHAIPEGALCLGSRVNAQGRSTATARLRWMHWQCGFKKHLNHLRNIHKVNSPEAITGFDGLKSADKFKVRDAWYKKPFTTQDTAHVGTPTAVSSAAAKTSGRAQRTPGKQTTIPRAQNQVHLGEIKGYDRLRPTDKAKVWDARAAGMSTADLRDLVVTLSNAFATVAG